MDKNTKSKMVSIVALGIAAGLMACGPQQLEQMSFETPNGIINGEETGYEEWTGVVAVVYSGSSLCTGTLLHPSVVLTAGHCVYSPDYGIDALDEPENIKIYGGASIFKQPKLLAEASEVIIHEGWEGKLSTGYETDLALIILEEPIEHLPTYKIRYMNPPREGDAGIIVGYGLGTAHESKTSGVHRVGNTAILSVEDEIVELGGETGTCSGDSGGPLFTKQGDEWVVTGVASYVEGKSYDCPAANGSWDVNLVTFRSWIDEKMALWTGSGLERPDYKGENGIALEKNMAVHDTTPGATNEEAPFFDDGDGMEDVMVSSDGCSMVSPREQKPGAFGLLFNLFLQ